MALPPPATFLLFKCEVKVMVTSTRLLKVMKSIVIKLLGARLLLIPLSPML